MTPPEVTSRLTVSVPRTLTRDLDILSDRMKISRSALVTELLQDPVARMAKMISKLPSKPADADVKRFRGGSIDMITHAVGEALRVVGGVQ